MTREDETLADRVEEALVWSPAERLYRHFTGRDDMELVMASHTDAPAVDMEAAINKIIARHGLTEHMEEIKRAIIVHASVEALRETIRRYQTGKAIEKEVVTL